jgi:hypothetical protein
LCRAEPQFYRATLRGEHDEDAKAHDGASAEGNE